MTDVPQDRYTHGHHESVVQNHARRRAEVDAWFLLAAPELPECACLMQDAARAQ